jgi:hypothetical protein
MLNRSRSEIDAFIAEISSYEADGVFNPWRMNCQASDSESSFCVRQDNLRTVLTACAGSQEVDVWVGRDLGWRGGRRTGVALVDEPSLHDYALSIGAPQVRKATADSVMRERTATEVHMARARVARKIFFWNVFPFHPHEEGKPQSNRMHTRREREVGLHFLSTILALMPVGQVVSIGNDATSALQAAEVQCLPVRHPSYGGQKEFHHQIDQHYGIDRTCSKQLDLFA